MSYTVTLPRPGTGYTICPECKRKTAAHHLTCQLCGFTRQRKPVYARKTTKVKPARRVAARTRKPTSVTAKPLTPKRIHTLIKQHANEIKKLSKMLATL
jgi:hypothetical protein